MPIYTKTGDKGETSLFNGDRVKKYDLRVEAYGTFDETNAAIATAIAFSPENLLKADLENITYAMFKLCADLATPTGDERAEAKISRMDSVDVENLEELIDSYYEQIPKAHAFVLPLGTKTASLLHNARTICRRAERILVKFAEEVEINPFALQYANRLSDYLFAAARYANFLEHFEEIKWKPKK